MDNLILPGNDTANENKFNFGSGLLCLDFANTAGWHASSQPVERLTSYRDLVHWASAAGVLEASYAAHLLDLESRDGHKAMQCLEQAIELREVLYRIFAACANDRPVDEKDLESFNAHLRYAFSHARIQLDGKESRWEWEDLPEALERPLWPVVRSALEVITSEQLQRVGQCQDDRGCGWLFLDTSRNRTRRWCSMESCGNRAKAQRHYSRAKQS